jgi:PAS domain S-box-containing protein
MAEPPQQRNEERARVEKSLRSSEELLADIVETVPVGIVIVDSGSSITFANATAEEILGLERSKVAGRTYNDPAWKITAVDGGLFPDEDLPFSRVMATGEGVRGVEHAIEHPDGTRVILSINAAPLHDAEGHIMGMVTSLRDITDMKRAEIDLKASEARFRELFENMSSGVAIYEAIDGGCDFLFKDFNRAAERIEKVDRRDVIGKSVLEAFPGVRDFGLFDVFRHVWKSGKPEHFPITLYQDERIRGWRDNYVFKLPSGEIVAVYDDVTERKQAEQELRESQAMIQRIMDATPNIIYIYDLREGKNVYINRKILDLLGYSPQQIQDMGDAIIDKVIHPDDREKVAGFFASFDDLPEGEVLDLEYRQLAVNGESRWFYSRTTVFSRDEEGRPLEVLGEIQDITERKETEEKARSLNRFYSVLSAIDRAIVRVRDPEELLKEACGIAVEQGLFEMAWVGRADEGDRFIKPVAWHGVDEAYINGIRISVDDVPEGRGPTGSAVREGRLIVCNDIANDPRMAPWRDNALRRGYRSSAAFPLRLPEGARGALNVYSSERGFFDAREISLMEELASDISFALASIEHEKKRGLAEEELQRNERYLRSIIRNAPDMITILNNDLTFRWGSPSSGAITGYAAKDIYGRSIYDYVHPDEVEYARNALDFVVRNPGHPSLVEFRFRHADGSYHYHEGTFSNLLGDPSVKGIVCNTRDISERKQGEEDMRRAMERLRSLREIDAGILEARSPAETAQAALRHLRRLIPSRRAGVVLIDTTAQEAEILSYDTDDATSLKPGTRFSTAEGFLIESMLKGEIRLIEDIDLIRNPSPVFAQLRAEGMRSGVYIPLTAHGELVGLLSMESDRPGAFSMVDIDVSTEMASHLAVALYNARLFDEVQRHAGELELRVAERTAQLEDANRELEAFSYSVSHDLRAPLRAVDGFSQALLEDYYDQIDEQGKGYLNRIRTAAQRMAELIDDILGLSRVARSEMRREPVDMSALAARIARELAVQEPHRRVEFVIEPGVVVSGDPVLLGIALSNLLDNAFKFTGGREEARIEFGLEKIAGKDTCFVRDNGAGFDMEYAGKLFGVFQRLHSAEEFPGTGIGLATVQRIVHRHGGEVWGRGEVDKGATFYFTIPGG